MYQWICWVKSEAAYCYLISVVYTVKSSRFVSFGVFVASELMNDVRASSFVRNLVESIGNSEIKIGFLRSWQMVKRFSFCFSVSRRKTNLAATFLVWTFFYWNLMTRLTEILVTSANSQTVNLSAVISHFFTNFHHKIIAFAHRRSFRTWICLLQLTADRLWNA